MEKEFEAKLKSGLDQLDAIAPSHPPELPYFVALVRKQKKEIRMQLIKDLILFWLVSVIVIFIAISSLFQSVMLYLVLQFVVVLLPLVPWVYKRAKGEKI